MTIDGVVFVIDPGFAKQKVNTGSFIACLTKGENTAKIFWICFVLPVFLFNGAGLQNHMSTRDGASMH